MQNLILIGMPGAGKSTIGVLLAKELGVEFVDTDILIQLQEGKTLQHILDASDYLALRQIEERILLGLEPNQKVIATGGSAVYSEKGMQHLKAHGYVIFLDLPLPQLRRRIHNFNTRGIARAPEQSLNALFTERRLLYQRYADITLACRGKSAQQSVNILISKLSRLNQPAV